MRIGMDYRSARHGRGGIAIYARELAAALAQLPQTHALVLYAKQWRGRVERTPAHTALVPPGARLVDGRLPARVLRTLARVGFAADDVLGGVDVFHLVDYANLPTRRAARVVTIHDVLFERLPECYTPEMLAGLRGTTTALVRDAARVIVPSHEAARDLTAFYDVAPSRITVIPHGVPTQSLLVAEVEPSDVTPPADLAAAPYLFMPGTLEPRKNHVRLIEAFRGLRGSHPTLQLRIAGARGWMDAPILDAVRRTPGVHYEGAVSAARWQALLHGARAVTYPSLGEGFGLPVLEGLAAGKPTLVGAGGACEEVGEGHVTAVDPRSVEALRDGLLSICAPQAAHTVAAARTHAASFTWARTARATHAVYVTACMTTLRGQGAEPTCSL